MTHLIWTKIFVASLIFLGDGAFTPEVNNLTDAEASIISNTIQPSQADFLDEHESNSHPVFASTSTQLSNAHFSYQTVTSPDALVSSFLKYDPFNPRAPPSPLS